MSSAHAVGEAASLSGLSARMIRYYEQRGVVRGARARDGVTVSGPTQRLDRRRGEHAVDHLVRAAARIESVLRGGRKPAAVLEVIPRPGGAG